MLLRCQVKDKTGGIHVTHWEEAKYIQYWWRNPNKNDNFEYLGTDTGMILQQILKKTMVVSAEVQ